MAKAKDLHAQAVDELEAQLLDAQKELFKMENEAKQAKKAEKPHRIRSKRRDIARLLTIIWEKKHEQETQMARG